MHEILLHIWCTFYAELFTNDMQTKKFLKFAASINKSGDSCSKIDLKIISVAFEYFLRLGKKV